MRKADDMIRKQADVLERISSLNVWRRRSERAPHKPLLLLVALARVTQGADRLIKFEELDTILHRLLLQYGPPRHSVHPEYPFWRLQADGIREVVSSQSLTPRRGNTDPLKSELLMYGVKGGFPENIWSEFCGDRAFLEKVARMLLEAHFPESFHDDILTDVGLVLSSTVLPCRRRADFSANVLKAYGNCCAVCGYDVRVGQGTLGIEAAHIKWHQAGGPDEIHNGLALCTIHHKALDYGAIGITDARTIILSCDVSGSSVATWFEPFHGKPLRRAGRNDWAPKLDYIRWHTVEVFRMPSRDLPLAR